MLFSLAYASGKTRVALSCEQLTGHLSLITLFDHQDAAMIASFDQAYPDTNMPANPGPNNQIQRVAILPCWTNAAISALVK